MDGRKNAQEAHRLLCFCAFCAFSRRISLLGFGWQFDVDQPGCSSTAPKRIRVGNDSERLSMCDRPSAGEARFQFMAVLS
jgi:hypothetical protein